jgi:hypothetical protein
MIHMREGKETVMEGVMEGVIHLPTYGRYC